MSFASFLPKAAACAWLALPAATQSFVKNTTDIPQTGGDTEQIDFADVDLDGDWDAALANGGDYAPQQDLLWINQGYLQGGAVGVFLDETTSRLPLGPDPSRDVEFADIDADADADLYVTAHSSTVNAGARWWVNEGGEQGGVLGFYDDQTATRWVGLGAPGSSIAPAQILPSGSFVDWSGDGDFADLDNDGDLDLVHSSYGGSYSGNVPTRIFLNDGDGFFQEFNPSGVMLASSTIPDGTPALWCQGVHLDNTADTTGAQADIAEPVVDFDLGDTDGDFDVDIVLSGQQSSKPRFYRNRLDQGSLAFRDESALAFPGITLSGLTYEQELGDLDDDGDLDLYGVNWKQTGSSLFDTTLANAGGVFGAQTVVPGSGADDEEADFLDYDNDGDLDVYVASFSGQHKLHQNQGGAPIAFLDVAASELPFGLTAVARDVETADVDNDGDYDAFVANYGTTSEYYLENISQVADTTPPSVPAVEALAATTAASGVRPVRARVLDNAGYYTVWYYDVALETAVDGVLLPERPLASSHGAIFRGELPANLVGQVSYRVRATDPYGNSGVSSTAVYSASGDDGTSFGAQSASTGGVPPTLQALSEARAGATLFLAGQGIPGAPGFLGISLASLPPVAVPGLPNLILNLDPGALIFTGFDAIGPTGDLVFPLPVPAGTTGATVYAQFLDLAAGGTFGSSLGLSLTIH